MSWIVIWQQWKRSYPVVVHGDGDVVQNHCKNVSVAGCDLSTMNEVGVHVVHLRRRRVCESQEVEMCRGLIINV